MRTDNANDDGQPYGGGGGGGAVCCYIASYIANECYACECEAKRNEVKSRNFAAVYLNSAENFSDKINVYCCCSDGVKWFTTLHATLIIFI